jgi:hypothetical protein
MVVLDEAAYVPESLYLSAAPMLAVSDGQMIALSTPAGMRGWFYRMCTELDLGWQVHRIRASDCSRISPEFLNKMRKRLTDAEFRSEFEAEFVAGVGGVFSADTINRAFRDLPKVSLDDPPWWSSTR